MVDVNLVSQYNRIRNLTIFKGCFHEDINCSNTVIKAHSVQNNRILNKISRDGNVMCMDFSKPPEDGLLRLHPVGRKKASTFTGFCGYHDSKIFSPIENMDYSLGNREQEYLFAYRALALGYYERQSAYQFNKVRLSNENLTLESRKEAEKICIAYENHLKAVERYRTAMNINLDKKKFNKICTKVLVWPQEYGIAVSSMIAIYRDLKDKTINSQNDYSPTFFTVFPQSGFTYALLGNFTKDNGRFETVMKQIVSLSIEQQKVLITNMIFGKLENFFISPDLWDTLPESIRQRLISVLTLSTKKRQYNLLAYPDLNIFR